LTYYEIYFGIFFNYDFYFWFWRIIIFLFVGKYFLFLFSGRFGESRDGVFNYLFLFFILENYYFLSSKEYFIFYFISSRIWNNVFWSYLKFYHRFSEFFNKLLHKFRDSRTWTRILYMTNLWLNVVRIFMNYMICE